MPACSVTHAYQQLPDAETATTIHVEARITCQDAASKYWASLDVTDQNNGNVVAYAHTSGDYVSGSTTLSADANAPTRHLYISNLLVGFVGLPSVGLGPPQCIPDLDSLTCNFNQPIIGLNPKPASSSPPFSTPFSFFQSVSIAGQSCWFSAEARKGSGIGLHYGGSQNCRGIGSITLFLDRQKAVKVSSIKWSYQYCDPSPPHTCFDNPSPYHAGKTYLLAIPGHVYTLELRATMLGSAASLPSGCELIGSVSTECSYDINIKYVG